MDPVEVERTKLLANALNTACTSCFTVGILTPMAGYIYNVGGLRASMEPSYLVGGIVGWLFAAILLHWSARYVLGALRP